MSDMDRLIRERRSVRLYTEEMIPTAQVEAIIEAGCWAPTACNKQEYFFIYIDDRTRLHQLQTLGTAAFVSKAQQAILVLYGNQIDNVEYHDDKLSAGAVIQNMLLKATELGIGACEVCNLPSKRALRKLFDIPKGLDPIALVTIGFALKQPKLVERKNALDQVISHNTFSQNKEMWKAKPLMFRMRKYARSLYIRLPKTKWMLDMLHKVEKKFEN